MKNHIHITLLIVILSLQVSPNLAQAITSGNAGVPAKSLRNFTTKFHFSVSLNYGNFNYTESIESALMKSGYRAQVVVPYDAGYSDNDFLLNLLTFGLFSGDYDLNFNNSQMSYEKPVFAKTSSVPRIEAAYNLKPRLQLGAAYNGYSNEIYVCHMPDVSTTLQLDVSVNTIQAYAAYDLTRYQRKRRSSLGLRLGAGLSGNLVNENQQYRLFNTTSVEYSTENYSSKKFQFGIMLNAKIDWYLGKHFSITLLDITLNQPVNQPKTGQSDAAGSRSLESHKVDSQSFTAGFGLGLHF